MPNITVNIGLGELAKPATTLVERISDAVGLFYAPTHKVRMAKAEADAAKIAALSKIELSEIEQRGLQRFVYEQGKQQENMEAIAKDALRDVNDDARPEEMDEDWITSFFAKARYVSNEEMRSLWSRVLAGEANKPGSFSRRTVEFLPALTKDDAALFTTFCMFCWMIDDLTPLVFDRDLEVYNKSGIHFGSLSHLDDIGLISFNLNGFVKQCLPEELHVSYYGQSIILHGTPGWELKIGQCLLTNVGRELAPISGSQPNDTYFQWVLQRFTNEGREPFCPVPRGADGRMGVGS